MFSECVRDWAAREISRRCTIRSTRKPEAVRTEQARIQYGGHWAKNGGLLTKMTGFDEIGGHLTKIVDT